MRKVSLLAAGALALSVSWAGPVTVAAAATGAGSLARPGVGQLIPQGAPIALSRSWTNNGAKYAVLATGWSPTQPTPWMIVAKKTATGWEPLYVAQTQNAFAVQKIVLSPASSSGTAVSLSFIVDAATGLVSNVYTLWVTPHSARLVAHLPDVVALTDLSATADGIEVNGLNLQATVVVADGRATVRFTPLRTLLEGATHPVEFVMGWTNENGKTVKKISLLGSGVIHARAGDTLSFVPMNSQAVLHMLGSQYEQDGFTGISVYAAAPGTAPGLYQAAQELSNTVRLTKPGTYTFTIVPPDYRPLVPNEQAAVLHVVVRP